MKIPMASPFSANSESGRTSDIVAGMGVHRGPCIPDCRILGLMAVIYRNTSLTAFKVS